MWLYWMAVEFLYEDLIGFVLWFPDSLFYFMLQQSDSVLFDSLRRLQLMELTVDLLKV